MGLELPFTASEKLEIKFILVALLRQAKGCVITDSLEISDVNHLETDKLHAACCIDINDWKRCPEDPYITFIKGKSSLSTPKYFLQAIGCTEYTDSRTQTRELVNALNEYCKINSFSREQKQELRQKILIICSIGEHVSIDMISMTVDEENPQNFIDFINKGKYKIGNGFIPHKQELRAFRMVHASGDGITLKCEASMIGNKINLETDAGGKKCITITDPPEKIVKAIEEAAL